MTSQGTVWAAARARLKGTLQLRGLMAEPDGVPGMQARE